MVNLAFSILGVPTGMWILWQQCHPNGSHAGYQKFLGYKAFSGSGYMWAHSPNTSLPRWIRGVHLLSSSPVHIPSTQSLTHTLDTHTSQTPTSPPFPDAAWNTHPCPGAAWVHTPAQVHAGDKFGLRMDFSCCSDAQQRKEVHIYIGELYSGCILCRPYKISSYNDVG